MRKYLVLGVFSLILWTVQGQNPIKGYQGKPIYHKGIQAGYEFHLVDQNFKLSETSFVSEVMKNYDIGDPIRSEGSVIIHRGLLNTYVWSRATLLVELRIEFKNDEQFQWVKEAAIFSLVPMKCDKIRLIKLPETPNPPGSPIVDLGEYDIECDGVTYPIGFFDKCAYDTGDYHLMRNLFGKVKILGNQPDKGLEKYFQR